MTWHLRDALHVNRDVVREVRGPNATAYRHTFEPPRVLVSLHSSSVARTRSRAASSDEPRGGRLSGSGAGVARPFAPRSAPPRGDPRQFCKKKLERGVSPPLTGGGRQ